MSIVLMAENQVNPKTMLLVKTLFSMLRSLLAYTESFYGEKQGSEMLHKLSKIPTV